MVYSAVAPTCVRTVHEPPIFIHIQFPFSTPECIIIIIITGVFRAKTTMIIRHAVGEGSGNFDHLVFFDVQ